MKKIGIVRKARLVFKDYPKLKITSEGERHLSAVIGSDMFRASYIEDKVKSWIEDVRELSLIAEDEPQAALSAFTKGLCRRWTYVQRTVSDIGHLFRPLENVIANEFIPSVVGGSVTPNERMVLALPVKHGGLGIQDPSQTAQLEYEASIQVTMQLKNLTVSQNNSLETLDQNVIRRVKEDLRNAKTSRYIQEFERLSQNLPPLTYRSITAEKEKGASAWLASLPLK